MTYAIDDLAAEKFDSALLHACIAIDATSKRLFPKTAQVGARYVKCIRSYYWILEPMFCAGINFCETRFTNVPLKKNNMPDIADIIYEIFRCGHAHGDEIPAAFSLIPSTGQFGATWSMQKNELHMPDRLVWGLLAISVFCQVNKDKRTTGSYFLSLGDDKFPLTNWWGREDDFRPFADKYTKVRVTLKGLDSLVSKDQPGAKAEVINIFNPPFV